MKPIIAIVGRPNVGKSTLFNRLVGTRQAIVDPTPGVTRDRLYADTDWRGQVFTLVDTGGFEPLRAEEIPRKVREQAEQAIAEADLIVFVVDGKAGLVATDVEVAAILRRTRKPLLLAVNKLDDSAHEPHMADFYALGIEPLLPISAEHGRGVGELLDALVERLPGVQAAMAPEQAIRVAVVGRPNVGKSTLVNALLGTPRLIVSPVPGTTRDAVDTLVTWGTQTFVLIDTAGVRRKARIDARLEWRSVAQSLHSIRRCQVALLVLDAQEGLTDQDTRLANYIHRMGKASVIIVNKADLLHGVGPPSSLAQRETAIRQALGSLGYSPILFISALTGQRLERIFPTIQTVMQAYQKRLLTSALNDCLHAAWSRRPPHDRRGRELKLFYATQIAVEPPTVIGFVNYPESLTPAFVRYLEHQLRHKFGFEGSPLKLLFQPRHRP
ncbi:MAG TPA: ribosome biogenesis GTPase Der [Candidatus Tectomicrobia bacterium]|nr:ribosome biogenesis GTPase Der [Candidatus Tectomicrobia bacterium]